MTINFPSRGSSTESEAYISTSIHHDPSPEYYTNHWAHVTCAMLLAHAYIYDFINVTILDPYAECMECKQTHADSSKYHFCSYGYASNPYSKCGKIQPYYKKLLTIEVNEHNKKTTKGTSPTPEQTSDPPSKPLPQLNQASTIDFSLPSCFTIKEDLCEAHDLPVPLPPTNCVRLCVDDHQGVPLINSYFPKYNTFIEGAYYEYEQQLNAHKRESNIATTSMNE